MKIRDRIRALVTDAYERGFDDGCRETAARLSAEVDEAFRRGYRSAKLVDDAGVLAKTREQLLAQRERAGRQ